MKEEKRFIAFDGKEFTDRDDCIRYEDRLNSDKLMQLGAEEITPIFDEAFLFLHQPVFVLNIKDEDALLKIDSLLCEADYTYSPKVVIKAIHRHKISYPLKGLLLIHEPDIATFISADNTYELINLVTDKLGDTNNA